MNAIRNKVQLIGNLGSAPEVKTLNNGNKVAKFAIATSDFYTNKNGDKVTETFWHNVVIWGKLADIAERYLQKGSQVVIEGKLTNRNYTDKEGVKRYFTEIVANELLMLDKK